MREQKCPICKKSTGKDNFCQYCRFPINVKKLKNYDKEEYKQSLLDLNKVLGGFNILEIEDNCLDFYHELFNMNWLRPETVIYQYMLIKALHKRKKYFKYPMLDLGCGDGTFTTILFGGKFKLIADNYGFVDLNKTDGYNNYNAYQKNILLKKPDRIGFGVDIKESSVKNARDLEVYDEIKIGDIRNLPFDNGSVNSVFSNMVDDIKTDDLSKVLKEAHRVLNDGGFFIFTTPTENYRKCLYYYPLAKRLFDEGKNEDAKRILRYDRGRSEWEPRSKEFWVEMLNNNSFEIIVYEPFFDKELLEFWDTGFRPFFSKSILLKELLSKNDILLEFKETALEILKNYFINFVSRPLSNETTFAVIVAKKVVKKNVRR